MQIRGAELRSNEILVHGESGFLRYSIHQRFRRGSWPGVPGERAGVAGNRLSYGGVTRRGSFVRESELFEYFSTIVFSQNEPGIQEVWDTVRRVRCLWEGNINKALTVNFSVDMLKQEIVTFSGDTAVAKLDIQVGRGPFAATADGLVKIGETMTLVVTVEGDPAFDLQVRSFRAFQRTRHSPSS